MKKQLASGTFVAVLMPSGKLFDDLYAKAVASCCRELGIRCERIPSEFSTKSALSDVKDQIAKANFVVADVSGRNPHIFYQVGLAHALNKKVVLLTQLGEDFPFDKKEHSVIVYAGNGLFLKTELQRTLQESLGQAGQPGPNKEDSVNQDHNHSADREKFMALFGEILEQHGYRHNGDIYLENPTTFVVVEQDMSLALVQDMSRKARELGIRVKLL